MRPPSRSWRSTLALAGRTAVLLLRAGRARARDARRVRKLNLPCGTGDSRRVRKFVVTALQGIFCSWNTVAKRGLGPARRVDGAVAACTDRPCQRGPAAGRAKAHAILERLAQSGASRCSPSARALGSRVATLPKYVTRPPEAVQRTGPLRRLARGAGHPGIAVATGNGSRRAARPTWSARGFSPANPL